MKNSRSIRIDQEIYNLLRAKKDELQKEKGKKITYSQLLKYLIDKSFSASETQEVPSLPSKVEVKIP